ncbi:hypothetical protein Tco_0277337 [Tanacetum coccineum]
MASAIICLATNQKFNFSKYIFESMVKNLDNAGKFLMYPRFVQVFLDKQLEGMSSHKSIYVTPSHTKIFRNMKRVGKGFSGRETPLFPIMVVQNQAEMGEGSAIPTDPHHTPTIIQPSTSQPQKKQRSRWLKRKDTEEITSLKLRVKKLEKKGGSRTHKLKRLYKVGRSARIVSSDEASLGDQEDASKHGRKIDDIDKDAKITLVDETHRRYGDDIMFDVSDLAGEEVFVAEQGVLNSKKDDATQVNTAVTTVNTASAILVSVASITDVKITLAQALAELKSAKPTTTTSTRSKAKGLVIYEQEQAPTPIKAEANNALKETWDDIQEKIKADCLLAERLKTREQEEKLFDKAMKRVNTFVDMDTELVEGSEVRVKGSETRVEGSSKRAGEELKQESSKKQKLEEEKETAELQRLIEVVPSKEEVAIDAIHLATKPPSIVNGRSTKKERKAITR